MRMTDEVALPMDMFNDIVYQQDIISLFRRRLLQFQKVSMNKTGIISTLLKERFCLYDTGNRQINTRYFTSPFGKRK